MEGQAPSSEISTRRLKRTRAQVQITRKQPSKENDADGENSEQLERENSPDDFEEARPKAK